MSMSSDHLRNSFFTHGGLWRGQTWTQMDILLASASTVAQITTRDISTENTNFQDIEMLVTRVPAATVAQRQ